MVQKKKPLHRELYFIWYPAISSHFESILGTLVIVPPPKSFLGTLIDKLTTPSLYVLMAIDAVWPFTEIVCHVAVDLNIAAALRVRVSAPSNLYIIVQAF